MGMGWRAAASGIHAALRVALRARWQICKLVVVALSLIVALVVLPRYYWSGGPTVLAQIIAWVAVVGGTGFFAMVMAADADSEG